MNCLQFVQNRVTELWRDVKMMKGVIGLLKITVLIVQKFYIGMAVPHDQCVPICAKDGPMNCWLIQLVGLSSVVRVIQSRIVE